MAMVALITVLAIKICHILLLTVAIIYAKVICRKKAYGLLANNASMAGIWCYIWLYS